MGTKLTDLENSLRHHYVVEPSGAFVPGVTTIIDVVDKPQLMWAASKIAAQSLVYNWGIKDNIIGSHRRFLVDTNGTSNWAYKRQQLGAYGGDDEVLIDWARGEFKRIWSTKAQTGTDVHSIAEAWSQGEIVDVPFELSGQVKALENFYLLYKPRFLFVETVVVNRQYRYGGRFDCICYLDGPGAEGTFWVDYKSGGEYLLAVALQLEAYSRCQFVTFNEDESLGALTDPPATDGARVVYLRANGSLKVLDPFENISRDDAWEAFKSCLTLYNFKQKVEALEKK
jgi:hypothetical protein